MCFLNSTGKKKSLINSLIKQKPDANRWLRVEHSKTISKSQNENKIFIFVDLPQHSFLKREKQGAGFSSCLGSHSLFTYQTFSSGIHFSVFVASSSYSVFSFSFCSLSTSPFSRWFYVTQVCVPHSQPCTWIQQQGNTLCAPSNRALFCTFFHHSRVTLKSKRLVDGTEALQRRGNITFP